MVAGSRSWSCVSGCGGGARILDGRVMSPVLCCLSYTAARIMRRRIDSVNVTCTPRSKSGLAASELAASPVPASPVGPSVPCLPCRSRLALLSQSLPRLPGRVALRPTVPFRSQPRLPRRVATRQSAPSLMPDRAQPGLSVPCRDCLASTGPRLDCLAPPCPTSTRRAMRSPDCPAVTGSAKRVRAVP